MKLKALILNAFLFFFIYGNAQINQKSFSDTTLWHMHSEFAWTEGVGGPVHHENFNTYRIVINDTIIQDTLYQLLYDCNSNFSPNDFSFLGYYKNINNRIYFGNKIDSMKLVYDYNLNIGDTFRFFSEKYTEPESYLVHVIDVDSVYINNRYRKKILFENFSGTNISPCWVEGIGDYNYGLLEHYGRIIFCEPQPGGQSILQCFTENDVSIIGDCKISIGLSEVKEQKYNVYPNPFKNIINIEIDKKIKNGVLKLYNEQSVLVDLRHITKSNIQLNYQDLEKGIYLLIITNKDLLFKKTIIKI